MFFSEKKKKPFLMKHTCQLQLSTLLSLSKFLRDHLRTPFALREIPLIVLHSMSWMYQIILFNFSVFLHKKHFFNFLFSCKLIFLI